MHLRVGQRTPAPIPTHKISHIYHHAIVSLKNSSIEVPADPRGRGLTPCGGAGWEAVVGVVLVSPTSAGVDAPRGVFAVDMSTTPGALPLNDFLSQTSIIYAKSKSKEL